MLPFFLIINRKRSWELISLGWSVHTDDIPENMG